MGVVASVLFSFPGLSRLAPVSQAKQLAQASSGLFSVAGQSLNIDAPTDCFPLPIWPLRRSLAAARKHGVTINDVLYASYISAYYDLHKAHNLNVDGNLIIMP